MEKECLRLLLRGKQPVSSAWHVVWKGCGYPEIGGGRWPRAGSYCCLRVPKNIAEDGTEAVAQGDLFQQGSRSVILGDEAAVRKSDSCETHHRLVLTLGLASGHRGAGHDYWHRSPLSRHDRLVCGFSESVWLEPHPVVGRIFADPGGGFYHGTNRRLPD